MALRLAFFYACGQFSGTISGLLAYAISFMDGVGGLAGWRWVFVLEGIPALLCGAYTHFFLPDYPDETSKFLTDAEKEVILRSVPKTQPKAKAKTWDRAQAKALVRDPTFATFLMIWICHAIGGWGVSKVLPTVVYDLGMEGSAVSQLMTMVRSLHRLDTSAEPRVLTWMIANLRLWLRLSSDHRLAHPNQTALFLGCCYWP